LIMPTTSSEQESISTPNENEKLRPKTIPCT
jgi:hypothetical protein